MPIGARPTLSLLPLTTLAVCSTLVLTTTPAAALTTARSTLVSDTNHARRHHDRHAYAVRDHLNEVAQKWAVWMASHRTLRHNPYLAQEGGDWRDLGENVGRGGSVTTVHRAFMNSSEHRDNILSRTFTQLGVGAARGRDGRVYVDEVFRRPM